MLTRSFCCFRGISVQAEQKLWRSGCLDWRMLSYGAGALSLRRQQNLLAQLPEMQAALQAGLAEYFLARLPVGHRLRVWPEFDGNTLFLDIETSGLGRDAKITVIGAYLNGQFHQYVLGRNLEQFLDLLAGAKLLVTFNGKCFDWPFIERHFGVSLSVPHIDLMYEFRAPGYTGGLKKIEQHLGLHRNEVEAGDGMMAVILWQQYAQDGSTAALDRLLEYNRRDVTSLVDLSRILLQRSIQNFPGP